MGRATGLAAALGRALMVAGGLVLAFAAFQLWGTGLAEAEAQTALESQFLGQLAAATTDDVPPSAADDHDHRVVEPPPDEPPVPISGRATASPPDPGDPVGLLEIPAIGVRKTIVEGTTRDALRSGPGHYRSTPLPGGSGNVSIAGHRTTHGAPFFDIDLLQPGDEILVETLDGTFTYLVEDQGDGTGAGLGHRIVDPTDVGVLADRGDDRLTLTACHPKYSARQRIVVTATLAAGPWGDTRAAVAAPPEVAGSWSAADGQPEGEQLTAAPIGFTSSEPPPDPVVESLGWQPAHAGATALWSALTGLIAFGGWLGGRWWRRRPAYAMTVPPFTLALFTCFTNLDKLLPAV